MLEIKLEKFGSKRPIIPYRIEIYIGDHLVIHGVNAYHLRKGIMSLGRYMKGYAELMKPRHL